MKNMCCETEYGRTAMFSDMAFSACATGAKRNELNMLVRGTALAVSLFVFIFLVSVFAGIIGMLLAVSLLILSVIYIIADRLIISCHGKAYVEIEHPAFL